MPPVRAGFRIAALSVGHFVVGLLSAFAAEGWDLDQLRSRSPWSRAAGVVQDVLWFPHDAAMRAVPNAWLVSHREIVPIAIVANSLVWGMALYAVLRWARRI